MKRENSPFFLILIGGSIPVFIMIASYYSIPKEISIIFSTISILIFVSMALWWHANNNATGHEWWQDNHCSGWRGY